MSSTLKFPSTTHPGITIELKRIGQRKRAQYSPEMADTRGQLRSLYIALNEANVKLKNLLTAEIRARDHELTPEEIRELPVTGEMMDVAIERDRTVDRIAQVSDAEMKPFWITKALVKLHGGGMDHASADELVDEGPDDLAEEVFSLIDAAKGLTPQEAENLSLPTTSGESGQATNTTAPDALKTLSSATETVTT